MCIHNCHAYYYLPPGPDIDSPDREKRASIEELISDVSGLNLDHAHSPSHSRRTKDVQQESSTERTVTRHVTEPSSKGRSKTMTVYETICWQNFLSYTCNCVNVCLNYSKHLVLVHKSSEVIHYVFCIYTVWKIEWTIITNNYNNFISDVNIMI